MTWALLLGAFILFTGASACGSGADESCETQTRTYKKGDVWTCDDGCNTCSCRADNVVTSTSAACLTAPGVTAGRLFCTVGDKSHSHGSQWPCNGTQCGCDDGTVRPASELVELIESLTEPCIWDINELLRTAGADASERSDCGRVGSELSVADAMSCFDAARSTGAEFTLNRCTDCAIPNTFISTVEGELYRIILEEDLFGDELRTSSINSCETIEPTDNGQDVKCRAARRLYTCSEPLIRGAR